jgi:hypothetical protein
MVEQPSRGEDQDRAGLGLASRSWRQEQAEVTVGDPAGRQRLAERVGAELVHCPYPAFARRLVESGYPARRGR